MFLFEIQDKFAKYQEHDIKSVYYVVLPGSCLAVRTLPIHSFIRITKSKSVDNMNSFLIPTHSSKLSIIVFRKAPICPAVPSDAVLITSLS